MKDWYYVLKGTDVRKKKKKEESFIEEERDNDAREVELSVTGSGQLENAACYGYRCFVGGDDNDDATSSGGSNAHRVREFPMAGPPSTVVSPGSIAVTIALIMTANDHDDDDVTFNGFFFASEFTRDR